MGDTLDKLLGAIPAMAAEAAVEAEYRYRNHTSDFFLYKNQNIGHYTRISRTLLASSQKCTNPTCEFMTVLQDRNVCYAQSARAEVTVSVGLDLNS